MRKRHSYSSQPSVHSPRSNIASARMKCALGKNGSIRSARPAQRGLEFQAMVVDNVLIVQAQRIRWCQSSGLPRRHQRLIQPSQRAIDFAYVA
jgi:hypothetical protein